MTYKIGITGSIGTGKTTIAKMFALFNISVFDADQEIKKILRKKQIHLKLKKIWPSVIKKDYVDKLKIRSIIFSSKVEKEKLEKILYPYLEIELKRFENENCKDKILVYDVPLIYETKSEKRYDLILLTYCDKELQRKRVLARDNISNSLFDKTVATQLSFNEKKKFKPKVINTRNIKLFILIKVYLLIVKIQIRLRLKEWKRES